MFGFVLYLEVYMNLNNCWRWYCGSCFCCLSNKFQSIEARGRVSPNEPVPFTTCEPPKSEQFIGFFFGRLNGRLERAWNRSSKPFYGKKNTIFGIMEKHSRKTGKPLFYPKFTQKNRWFSCFFPGVFFQDGNNTCLTLP